MRRGTATRAAGDDAMTVKWKRQLSSRIPWMAKLVPVVILVLWLLGSIELVVDPGGSAPDGGYSPWLLQVGAVISWFLLLALFSTAQRLMMRVSIEDDMLVVSGILTTIRIPFSDVKDVRGTWAHPYTVTVEFTRPTPFGRTITFIAAGAAGTGDRLPEAGETISRLAWEARTLTSEAATPAPREVTGDPLPPDLRPF